MKNLLRFKTVLVLILLTSVTISADDWIQVESFRGYWKFNIGNNSDWARPDFNDRDWDEIRVPSTWENQGYHGYNGYAWYRKHFVLGGRSRSSVYYLHMGFIDDVDEIYLNGKLVGKSGEFPPSYTTAYNVFRKYPVPAEYLNMDGLNVISVKVFDGELGGGIVGGELGLFIRNYQLDLEVNLEGRWKFAVHDNLKWKDADYDDSKWGEILAPGFWESQGYSDYDGFAWYRKSFFVGNNLAGKKLVALLGKIDDLDEVYINGELIGSTGNMDEDPFFISFDQEYSEFRGYYLPKGVLKIGETNTIAVRVYDGFRDGGIYEGPLGLVTQEEYSAYWKRIRNPLQSLWEIIFER